MKEYRIGPDGKATFAIVQAEDELAAIGMVLGAGWAGARSMTATAGPGISLMAEFAGLGYYVEIPGVIWDMQRVGPSTGLPTRTSQGDIGFVATLSHGDTKHPMLFPCSVGRMLRDGERGFRSRRADADAGVRDVGPRPRHEQLDVGAVRSIPTKPINRGKVLDRRKTSNGWAASRATKMWTATRLAIARCREPIIPARRGSRAAAATTRKAQYSERPDDYANNMDRLARKFETARTLVPRPEMVRNDGNEIGIIAYGTSHHALVETLDQLQNEYGVKADYLRLRAYPFTRETHEFIAAHKRVYVVDQNRDGADASSC